MVSSYVSKYTFFMKNGIPQLQEIQKTYEESSLLWGMHCSGETGYAGSGLPDHPQDNRRG